MKKIAVYIVMLLLTITTFSHRHQIDSLKIDSLKKNVATPKEDTLTATAFIELALLAILEDSSLSYLNRAYDLSRKLGWKRGQALSLSYRGFHIGVTGNEVRGLRDLLEAISISEDINDSSILGRCLNGLGVLYLTIEDYPRSLHYLSRGYDMAKTMNNTRLIFATATNMADLYVRTKNADSALYYNNVCYQIANLSKDDGQLAWSFKGLGTTHFLLKNYDLALTYLYKGLDHAKASSKGNSAVLVAFITNSMAKTYLETGNRDSSIHYSRATMEYGKKSKYLPTILDSYKLMVAAFKGINADSTAKYFEFAYNLKDSLTSAAKRNDIASLSYNEEKRQNELFALREKQKEERKRNIQFASIGIGLISFIILALLLSRSIIVKSGLVRFLGVVTLLLVFEFINLLIHPFISDVTHHSPILMFLIMVSIAAMLVPAHHKLEHWITNQLVEKNKRIRLAAAKKTIASLEGQ